MERKVGNRVSYEDMVNPRKVGTIVREIPSEWGTHYEVEWEDGGISISDCRQVGWRKEPPKPTNARAVEDAMDALREIVDEINDPRLAPAIIRYTLAVQSLVADNLKIRDQP